MSDKIEEIRITLALNPKQIAERMLSGEVTSESHFVSQEDHLHVASLVDAAHREIVKQRAEIDRLRAELDVELFNRSLVKRALEGKP